MICPGNPVHLLGKPGSPGTVRALKERVRTFLGKLSEGKFVVVFMILVTFCYDFGGFLI